MNLKLISGKSRSNRWMGFQIINLAKNVFLYGSHHAIWPRKSWVLVMNNLPGTVGVVQPVIHAYEVFFTRRVHQYVHRSAMRMSANNNVFNSKSRNSEFNRGGLATADGTERRNDITCVSNNQEIAGIGVGDEIGIDTGIGTGDEEGFRILFACKTLKEVPL